MNLIDTAIGYCFPSWGLRRAAARHFLSVLERSQKAEDLLHRLRKENIRAAGPQGELEASRDKLLAMARHLDRRNSWTAGLMNSLADNIVGEGIRFEARNRRPTTNQLNQKLNAAIEDGFNRWADGVDVSRKTSFWEFQIQVERELWVANEVLIHFRRFRPRPGALELPLALEVIEAERLTEITEDLRSGGRIVQGVEFDAEGRIVAYHVWDVHPQDRILPRKPARVPAEDILHLYHGSYDRPNMPRGITKLAPAVNNLEALNSYMNKELQRADIAASFALMLKRKRGWGGKMPGFPSTGDPADKTDENNNPIGQLSGGMIFTGGEGDGIEGVGPAVQTTAFDGFVRLMLRGIAVALNVSYEFLAKDFTQTNFHSARQAKIEDRKHWRPRQRYLVRRFCEPIYREFHEAAAAVREAPFDTLPIERVIRAWRPPGWESVDRNLDIQAAVAAIKAGLSTPQREAAEMGGDYYDNVEQIQEAMQHAEETGVTLDVFLPRPSKAVETEEPKGNEEEEESEEPTSAAA